MQETTDCRAAPALLIPLALQISKEAVEGPQKSARARPQAPQRVPGPAAPACIGSLSR